MSSTLVDIGVHNIHKQGAYSIIWHEIFPLILDDLKDADRIIPPQNSTSTIEKPYTIRVKILV